MNKIDNTIQDSGLSASEFLTKNGANMYHEDDFAREAREKINTLVKKKIKKRTTFAMFKK